MKRGQFVSSDRRVIGRICGVLLAGLCVFCESPADSTSSDTSSSDGSASSDSTAAMPGELTYRLDWDLDGVELSDSVKLTTDTGYNVTLDAGYLVFYAAQLVPCSDDTVTVQSPLDWLWQTVAGKTAHAGHSGETDPSAVEQSRIESLTAPATIELGSVTVTPGEDGSRYCQSHYLIADTDSTTLDRPTDVEMNGSSLYYAGSWTRADSADTGTFVIRTNLAWGKIYEAEELNISGASFEVTLTRALGRSFDGIEFATDSEADMAKQFFRSLVANTTVTIVEK
ncbi:MAG: hypothetical protein ACI9OJ_003930 [Myxococcota bacterium]|jgi:hypothetical protein